MAITNDGRTLLQTNSNGHLFFYDVASEKLVLRGFEIDDAGPMTAALSPGRTVKESNDVIARFGWERFDRPIAVALVPARFR